ncbi:response regulator [Patescibacteria group bacterium]|nr:response regulator [Patescibacteria group bacterium]
MGEKKLILFIEDDLPTVEVYKTALEHAGFKVETALSGNDGIRKIKAKKPDLILLDFLLPDIDGLEVLKEIRAQKDAKDIPIFILTNYTDEKLGQKGLFLKNEKYLLKTKHTPRELVEKVRKELKC